MTARSRASKQIASYAIRHIRATRWFNDAGEIIASQVYLDPGRVRAQAQ
jgi:hypothetical protein